MKLTKLVSMTATVLLAAALASCGKQETSTVDKAAADVKAKAEAEVRKVADAAKELEAREIAIDAYIYAYPLVTMEYTRRVMTNTENPTAARRRRWASSRVCAHTRRSTTTR